MDYVYIKPDAAKPPKLGVDMFDTYEALVEHVRISLPLVYQEGLRGYVMVHPMPKPVVKASKAPKPVAPQQASAPAPPPPPPSSPPAPEEPVDPNVYLDKLITFDLLWKHLTKLGWKSRPGKGLVNHYYIIPG